MSICTLGFQVLSLYFLLFKQVSSKKFLWHAVRAVEGKEIISKFSLKRWLEGPFAPKLLTGDCGVDTKVLCHVNRLIFGSERRSHESLGKALSSVVFFPV